MKNVVIIAEAGVNHNGDINLAKRLIDLGAEAGVDYVKFQTWVTELLLDKEAPKAEYQKTNDGELTSQFEMLKQLELSYDDFIELNRYSNEKGVGFLSTPDEERSLDFLTDTLKLPILKIGSGEITNIPFLRKVGKKNKDVILSTGMSTLGDVERAYNTLIDSGAKSVALLHCTSNYPAAYNSVNLRAMNTLATAFKTRIGYSDHTEGISVSLAAVALGAEIIEKHFTLDRKMQGPDHKASMSPEELKMLVKEIRVVEEAMSGSGLKRIQSSEISTREVVLKGLYFNKDIEKGSLITEEILIGKRPNNEISALDIDKCIGKKLKRDVTEGQPIKWRDIDFEED